MPTRWYPAGARLASRPPSRAVTCPSGSRPPVHELTASQRVSPDSRKHTPVVPTYPDQPAGIATRNPLRSWYHAPPVGSAGPSGRRDAGGTTIGSVAGQAAARTGSTGPAGLGAAGADRRGADGAAPGHRPRSGREAATSAPLEATSTT